MSFARPKPAPTSQQGKVRAPGNARGSFRSRPAAAAVSAAAAAAPSKVHAPTASSLARSQSEDTVAPKRTEKKSGARAANAQGGSRSTGGKDSGEEDPARVRLREAYDDYMRARLLEARAKQDYHRATEIINKECAMLWTAHSRERTLQRDAEANLDAERYLKRFAEEKGAENESLRRLAEALPRAADGMERLAAALAAGQNYLKVDGVEVKRKDDDEEEEDEADAAKAVRKVLDERRSQWEELGKAGDCSGAAETVAELRESCQGVIEEEKECAEVLSRLEAAAVREESRRLSEGRHSNGGRGGNLLSLRLPPPVPEPKLVDF